MCARDSQSTSWPGATRERTASTLPIEPVGTNSAASWPNSAATRSSRRATVGSSPYTSSPTSALAIAARIASVGRVRVSLRRSITRPSCQAAYVVGVRPVGVAGPPSGRRARTSGPDPGCGHGRRRRPAARRSPASSCRKWPAPVIVTWSRPRAPGTRSWNTALPAAGRRVAVGVAGQERAVELLERPHRPAADAGTDVVAGQRQQRGHLPQPGRVALVGERRVVRRQHLGRQRRRSSRRRRSRWPAARAPAGCRAGSRPGPARGRPATRPRRAPPRSSRPASAGSAVCRIVLAATTRGEPVRLGGQHAEPDRSAPVLGDQRDVAQVEAGDQAPRPLDVPGERVVGGAHRLVGAAEADVVGRDHPDAAVDEHRHDRAVEVGPGGLAVQQQRDRAVRAAPRRGGASAPGRAPRPRRRRSAARTGSPAGR